LPPATFEKSRANLSLTRVDFFVTLRQFQAMK